MRTALAIDKPSYAQRHPAVNKVMVVIPPRAVPASRIRTALTMTALRVQIFRCGPTRCMVSVASIRPSLCSAFTEFSIVNMP